MKDLCVLYETTDRLNTPVTARGYFQIMKGRMTFNLFMVTMQHAYLDQST